MANWTGVITNAGNNVLLEWINEKTLHFDSAAAGQGTVETVGMLAQTALVNQKQVASIIGAERVSKGIRLKIRITAPQAAYTLNQYGVWASITGDSTTMIALFQHEKGIPIPSAAESPDFVYTFYALISTSNTGKWTVNIDTSASVTLEEMNAAIATAVATKEGVIKDASEKDSLADADCIAVVDSADGGKTKRVLWSTVKAALAKLFVPLTRKINGKTLSSDVTLTGENIKVSASSSTTIDAAIAPLGGATTAQAALAALGAGVRPNLLDNAIFIGGGTGYGTFPVNQKGVLSGNTDRQFICDRWGQFGSEWRLTKDGLVMAKRSDAAYWSFYQQIPVETVHQLVGKVVTVSVLLDSVLVTATQVLVSPVTYFPFENGERVEIYVPDDAVGSVQYYGSATTRTVKAMKFEIGTAQTLAYQDADGAWRLLPQPESDYAAQLLRCQQHYIQFLTVNGRYAAFINGTVGFATIQTPIQMAKKPVFQLLGADYGVLYDATAVPNGASVIEMDANSVVIQLTFPSDAGVMSANWGQCWFALDTGM